MPPPPHEKSPLTSRYRERVERARKKPRRSEQRFLVEREEEEEEEEEEEVSGKDYLRLTFPFLPKGAFTPPDMFLVESSSAEKPPPENYALAKPALKSAPQILVFLVFGQLLFWNAVKYEKPLFFFVLLLHTLMTCSKSQRSPKSN